MREEETGDSLNTYTYDVTGISSAVIDGVYRTYMKDTHGSVVGYYNASGERMKQYDYDAFGNRLEGSDPDPFGYCGEYYDSESGNIYLRARYYNSETGRFISEEPAKDGVNWYVYCGGDPVMKVDPSGCSWMSEQIEKAWDSLSWAFQNTDEMNTVDDEFRKASQREFWTTGSQIILRDHYGYETSAWMLEHALQDNPTDIYRDNNSRIAYLINTDSSYLEKLDEVISKSDNGKIIGYLSDIQFNNGDLYYSIHRATIYVEGYQKDDGQWLVHSTMVDVYDFTEIQSFMDDGDISMQAGLGTLANDAAVLSQSMGAINPYRVTVDFYTTR